MREADIFRQKIFDLAIHGRLTKRDKGDEPVEALLSRIAEAKRAYIAANKAKAEELEQIFLDEMPFELPRGWVWCRLGEIAYVASGSTPPKSCFAKSGVPYIKMYNVRNQAIDFDFKPQYVTADTHNRLLKRSRAGAGDLLMNIVGPPLGKLAIIPDNLRECNFNQAAVVIRPYAERETINRYLYYYLWQMDEINSLDTRGTAGQANISLTQCKNLRIPLPPLEEQKRIVARVDELLDAVTRYSAAMGKISNAASLMEKKVLDLAIRGKLSKQEKSDGSASEIIEEIAADKAKRIAKKQMRKEKPLPPIMPEDEPFELPKDWIWCRFGELCAYGQCEAVSFSGLPKNTWALDLEEIEKDTGRLIERKLVKDKQATSGKHLFKKGMLLYSKLRTYLNKVLIADQDGVCTSEIIPIDFHGFVNAAYVRIVLMSPYFLSYTASKCYGVKMPRVSTDDMRMAACPLPPLAEQKRIVERVDAILAECRKMRGE